MKRFAWAFALAPIIVFSSTTASVGQKPNKSTTEEGLETRTYYGTDSSTKKDGVYDLSNSPPDDATQVRIQNPVSIIFTGLYISSADELKTCPYWRGIMDTLKRTPKRNFLVIAKFAGASEWKPIRYFEGVELGKKSATTDALMYSAPYFTESRLEIRVIDVVDQDAIRKFGATLETLKTTSAILGQPEVTAAVGLATEFGAWLNSQQKNQTVLRSDLVLGDGNTGSSAAIEGAGKKHVLALVGTPCDMPDGFWNFTTHEYTLNRESGDLTVKARSPETKTSDAADQPSSPAKSGSPAKSRRSGKAKPVPADIIGIHRPMFAWVQIADTEKALEPAVLQAEAELGKLLQPTAAQGMYGSEQKVVKAAELVADRARLAGFRQAWFTKTAAVTDTKAVKIPFTNLIEGLERNWRNNFDEGVKTSYVDSLEQITRQRFMKDVTSESEDENGNAKTEKVGEKPDFAAYKSWFNSCAGLTISKGILGGTCSDDNPEATAASGKGAALRSRPIDPTKYAPGAPAPTDSDAALLNASQVEQLREFVGVHD